MADARTRHRSPDDSYEVMLKPALEDASLTDAEHRVVTHLATKPPAWTLIPKAIAADLDGGSRWTEAKVRRALTGLRAKGYVVTGQERNADGTFGGYSATLDRSRVLYSETAGQDRCAETGSPAAACEDSASSQLGTAAQFTGDRQNAQHIESTDLYSDYGSSSEGDAEAPSPGAPGSTTAKRGENNPAPDSRRSAAADSRKAAPARRPRVSPGMEDMDPFEAVRAASDAEARRMRKEGRQPRRRPQADGRHANADELTRVYWQKYGRRTTQTFMAVRSQLRRILSNPDVDAREVGMAVARLGKQSHDGVREHDSG